MSFGKFKDQKNDVDTSSNNEVTGEGKMFDFVKNQKQNIADSSAKVYFGQGSKILGNVYFEGVAEIHGEIEGEIVSKGSLNIGANANVKASITGQDVSIAGRVEGDIEATKKLYLKQPAFIIGNIKTPVLSMEEGVVFQGSCKMEKPIVNNGLIGSNNEQTDKVQQ